MTAKKLLRTTTAAIGVAAILLNATALVAAPASAATVALTPAQKIALLQQKVKYVFVIFQENISFDHYFGTFPGADGLYRHALTPAGTTPAAETASFLQRYLDTNGNTVFIRPFLVPQAVVSTTGSNAIIPIYPADEISVDHSHQGMANALDLDSNNVARNDRYAMNQENLTTTTDGNGTIVASGGGTPSATANYTLARKQQAEMDMSHLDCDTVPFMWSWANNFVLFDNFRQTIVGPSTPNAIAMIAGQSGETQWALHPSEGAAVSYPGGFVNIKNASYTSSTFGAANSNAFVPVVGDPGPFPGSAKDTNAVKPPYNADENAANPTFNLTFATQPLSFMGSNIGTIIKSDQNPRADLIDVQHDIFSIAANNKPVNWGWYQQGFNGNDACDTYEFTYGTGTPNPTNDPCLYSGYVLHHNGPQYFGYLGSNTQILQNNLHGAADFMTAVANQTLPSTGGVFYLRGGYNNNDGLVPVDPTVAIQHAFLGNDDHPAYSDHQISESLAAKAISAIAASPYWSQSAIVITYDETDGFYDHVPAVQRSTFADNSILAGGPRIPTIVISPYSKTHYVAHQYSEHGSVIKFIDKLFNLVPLANLPDEAHARTVGAALNHGTLGPSDDPANNLSDLTDAFDDNILQGNAPVLPASLATFTPQQINTLPHLATAGYSPNGYTNGACAAIGVLPTDFASPAAYQSGTPTDPYTITNGAPDVNPRPSQSPGIPAQNVTRQGNGTFTSPWIP